MSDIKPNDDQSPARSNGIISDLPQEARAYTTPEIAVCYGQGISDNHPGDPMHYRGIEKFAADLEARALLKADAFNNLDTIEAYAKIKNRGPWAMRAIDEAVALAADGEHWHRQRGSVTACGWLMFDCDHAPAGHLAKVRRWINALGAQALIYTTTGHNLEIKGGYESFRLFMFLREPVAGPIACAVSRELREAVLPPATYTAEVNGRQAVRNCWDGCGDEPTRFMFLPLKGQPVEVFHAMGWCLDAAQWFKHRDLSLVAADDFDLGEAYIGSFGEVVDLLLSVPGAHLHTQPDGRQGVRMPGQQPEQYSNGPDNGDGWIFLFPNGDREQLNFHSLHALTEPEDTFKTADAIQVIAEQYDLPELLPAFEKAKSGAGRAADLEKGRKNLERLEEKRAERKGRTPRQPAADNEKPAKVTDAERFERNYAPQTEEIAELLIRLLYANGVPKGHLDDPEGLALYGIDVLALDDVFKASFYAPAKRMLYSMDPRDGKVAAYARADLPVLLSNFPPIIDPRNAMIADAVRKAAEKAAQAAQDGEQAPEEKPGRGRPKKAPAPFGEALAAYALKLIEEKLIEGRCQASAIAHRVDMFAQAPRMEIDHYGLATFTQPFRRFKTGRSLGTDAQRLLSIYLEHFPQFEELLEFLAAARFASDRKNAFLWLHCPSDWGKGFTAGVLSDLGLIVDIEEEQLYSLLRGQATGVSPGAFVQAWALLINECKKVADGVKRLEKGLTLNPKYNMETRVEVFAKLFTSADGLDALTGSHGVEEQLARRFNVWELEGEITAIPKWADVKAAMFRAVKAHASRYLNQIVERYISAGEHEAVRMADSHLAAFAAQYGIAKTYGRLSDNFDEIREEFFAWCCDVSRASDPAFMEKRIAIPGGLFLLHHRVVFEQWVKDHYPRDMQGSLIKNTNAILGTPVQPRAANQRRGVWVRKDKSGRSPRSNVIAMRG
ncbi:hypothetical protein [Aeromonas dhakensis]|uniref:hypothetical protein n=1 Tax=Aeromonas dhakensis TaxID=196024 RepID=UPI0005A91EA7|nr:hypothetical protein [Aeromonas dhakensis]